MHPEDSQNRFRQVDTTTLILSICGMPRVVSTAIGTGDYSCTVAVCVLSCVCVCVCVCVCTRVRVRVCVCVCVCGQKQSVCPA